MKVMFSALKFKRFLWAKLSLSTLSISEGLPTIKNLYKSLVAFYLRLAVINKGKVLVRYRHFISKQLKTTEM